MRPTLKYLDPVIPYSLDAENLLLGTCAQESAMGEYLVQLGGGPARGIYQMEPRTEADIIINFLKNRKDLLLIINNATVGTENRLLDDLTSNLFYATAMARVHYWRVPEPLPAHDDVEGMAYYWKKHYNTFKGKGTVIEFFDNYARYVEG